MAANELTPEEKAARKREYDRAYHAKRHEDHPEKNREMKATQYRADPAKHAAQKAAYRAANPERQPAADKRYREKNLVKRKAARKVWGDANRDHVSEYMRAYRVENVGMIEENRKARARIPKFRIIRILQSAKVRARKVGLEFESDLQVKLPAEAPENCVCCGCRLDYSLAPLGITLSIPKNAAPSIDRFDNSKGYTIANTVIICFRCNILKRDATLQELEAVVAYMRSRP